MGRRTPDEMLLESSKQTEPDGFEKLDPRSVTVERIGWAIFLGFVTVVALIILVPVFFAGDGFSLAWFILASIALAIIGLVTFMLAWMPRKDYEAKRLRLDDFGIEIHRGVFWKRRQLIPRSRIQHTDVSQGPLQRRFGLGTIKLHTAGTLNATIALEGLAHTRAVELRDRLVLDDEPEAEAELVVAEPEVEPFPPAIEARDDHA